MIKMLRMYQQCQSLKLSDYISPDKNDILILSKLTKNKERIIDFNQNYRKKNKLEKIFMVLKYENVLHVWNVWKVSPMPKSKIIRLYFS